MQLLRSLLRQKNTTTQLPFEFCNVLQKGKKRLGLKVFAETFKVIGNPLVIAKLRNASSQIVCPDAVFVDLTIYRNRELNFSQHGLHLCKFITPIKVVLQCHKHRHHLLLRKHRIIQMRLETQVLLATWNSTCKIASKQSTIRTKTNKPMT